ncbi:hypothetical protein Salat_1553700 [Sesamum alatum]|uniref:Uncharacterized protein n=1 Tax=Sesamum alatum TaxID=300844 RepID=A0AAE2CMP5_9LAMI|nr:hypothetical protein Salat_1553700 [Sesamum alatum]
MGCFLACFGIKKKKNRRKPGKKSPSQEHNRGSYVPLDSEASIKLGIDENHVTSDSCQLKEKAISKIKKKVTFNLNVKAYEPIPDDDDDIGTYLSEGEEATKWEFDTEADSIGIQYSYPTSYRYRNCRDSYDDEDEDLNFDEVDDSDDEVDDFCSDDDTLSEEDFSWKSSSVVVESDKEVISNQITEEKNGNSLDLLQSREVEGLGSNVYARDRSQYVSSVLNPVENLTQWKAVKAKAATPQLKYQKENSMLKQEGQNHSSTRADSDSLAFKKTRSLSVSRPQLPTVAVDASLSNWLGSLETKSIIKNGRSGQLFDRNSSDV